MKTYEIKGEVRENLGKKETKSLRLEGSIPCVIYGGESPVHFHASEKQFRKLVYTAEVYLVSISLGDKTYTSVMKEIQFHPVTDKILHVDFIEVLDGKEVKIEIPVNLVGTSIGERNGGKVRVNYRRLAVKGLAENLPENLDVNVEKLTIGTAVKIRDLSFPNLELLNAPSDVVVAVKTSRKAVEVEEDEEGEGAAAEGAEASAEAAE